MARRSLALPPAAIDRWCQYAQGEVSHIAEASGFVNFELSFDGARERRVISPQHYIITFTNRDKGRSRNHSSFLTLRLAPEETLPEHVQVGVEVRGRDGESVVCEGEYVEFELLSLVNDASKQPSLRIAAGPVRVNPETQQREFMRIDLGRCVRQIVTDIIDDPKHRGQKLVRSRWWICVEVLRLVCSANSLDCSALDTAGASPLEWVICLVDEKGASSNNVKQDEKTVDELAKFINGGGDGKKKGRKKKKGKGDTAADDGADDGLDAADDEISESLAASLGKSTMQQSSLGHAGVNEPPLGQGSLSGLRTSPLPPRGDTGALRGGIGLGAGLVAGGSPLGGGAATRPAPPPGWSRTVDLSPALVDAWRDCAGCDVRHIAESTSYVHFALNFSKEQRCRLISPAQYVIAFPHVNTGQHTYHSALLTLGIVRESDIPDGAQGSAESIEFRLLARENEAPVRTALRFTAGPVRINDKTGQRESMRLDLGECVRWAPPDYVEGLVNGQLTQLVRQRWWVSIETLRLICIANSLNCEGLDEPGAAPLEWVVCLVDDRTPASNRAMDLLGSTNAQQLRTIFDNLPSNAGDANGSSGANAGGVSLDAGKSKAKKKKDALESVAPATASLPKAVAASKVMPAPKPEKQTPPPASEEEPRTPSECTAEEDEDASEFMDAADSSADLPQPEVKRPPASGKPAPPSRTLALPSALIDSWCHFARKNVTHVAEATGFVHFELNFDKEGNRRVVSPEHYIIAFPNRDKGRQRYHSSLLALKIVKESDIPPEGVIRPPSETATGDNVEYVEFELLLRVHEAPVQQQLRITAGPVRLNTATGQRESMRIDLGRCVRQILTDVVDDPRGKRVVRNRWWICIEMLRLVCTANSLDCKALDASGHLPVEWVVCLVDERNAQTNEGKQPEEERNIDDLIDFIDGKGGSSKKKKKKKPREKEDKVETVHVPPPVLLPQQQAAPMSASQAAAAALSQVAPMSASQAAAAALSQAGVPSSTSAQIDPMIQAQAAAQLLAEAAASCTSPQQAAAANAAAEAARLAVEAASSSRPNARNSGAVHFGHPHRPAAADMLRAAEVQQPARPSMTPARPLLSNWEPTPLPVGFEDEQAGWPPALGSLSAAAAGLPARAERAFDGLESLLAGLRSEFSEESRASKRWESRPDFLGSSMLS